MERAVPERGLCVGGLEAQSLTKAMFTFHQKLFILSHQIFEHMYGALNVDKKLITQFA
jgi:hypothetical protein